MALVEWSEDFKIGEGQIDKEHWGLFALINDLHDKYEGGAALESIGATLDALEVYVETHFEHEELFMDEIEYPLIQEHKSAHRRLDRKVRDYSAAFREAPETFDASDFLEFLSNWLKDHILTMDMELARYHHSP